MLQDAWFLARKDFWRLLRSAPTIVWTFLMPVVFFYLIGTITGGFGGGGQTKDSLAVLVPADAGFLADALLARLADQDFTIVRATPGEEFQRYRRRLEIPAGFTESVLAGKPRKLKFSRTGDDNGADYDRVRLSRAAYTILADLIATHVKGAAPTAAALEALAREPRNLIVESKPAGKRVEPPVGFEQSVPGTMVQFTMLVLFTSGAVTLTIERNQGILRRLASSPMSRGAVVLGKWGARMGLGIIQISFALIAGNVLLHVRWGANLPYVILVMFAYGALSASLGMLLGNLGKTEGQVIPIGVIASNLLAGLGGCWWPIEVAPIWAQKLAMFLPTGWAMDALHKLVNFGLGPESVLLNIGATAACALLAGYAAAKTFRFQ